MNSMTSAFMEIADSVIPRRSSSGSATATAISMISTST